jgi:hypothetical protein
MFKLVEIVKTGLFAVTLSLLLLFSGGAIAEEAASGSIYSDADPNPNSWRSTAFSPVVGSLYAIGGVGFYDFDSMNDSFSDNGYSTLKSPAFALGFGTDVSIGRLIVGGEWNWLWNVGTTSEADNIDVNIKSNYWLFRMGVDLVKWRGLRVYPLFGIGSATTKLTMTEENGASFDEVLEDPGRDSRMTKTELLLDASLGIDYRFKVRENENKASFFTVGVRGGYLFTPYAGEWKTGGAEIYGGPENVVGGPTVQLMIGFSGEHKKRHSMSCNCSKH